MSRVAARRAIRIAAASALLATGCSLNLSKEEGQLTRNGCAGDGDCPGGSCWSGMCVANQGSLSSVLIQVTPPTSVAGVGGTRLSPIPNSIVTFTQSSSDFKVHLPATTAAKGVLLLGEDIPAECTSLQVTLIPLEQGFGLPAVSYVAQATPATEAVGCPMQPGAHAVTFDVNVAPGRYDIYVDRGPSAAGASPTADCAFVPRLFREVPIATTTCLSSGVPKTLSVKIQWPAGSAGISTLEGWTVDIVHPTTGQLLSDRRVVPAEGTVSLSYSDVASLTGSGAAAYEDSGQDLVRLTPPHGVTAPVVQFVRSGLEALSIPNNGVTPLLGPFPAPVHVQGWVYKEEDDEMGRSVPVQSTLSLTATKIPGVTGGIFASFEKQVEVGGDGKFEADLLPGDYRVRAVPRAGLGLAAVETALSVRCAPDPEDPAQCAIGSGSEPVVEAGKTLLVPRAASIEGRVAAPYGGGTISGAQVLASPAAFGRHSCMTGDGGLDAGGADGGCAVTRLGVLEIALGEGAFVPRSVTAAATPSPSQSGLLDFGLHEVDCGGCGKGEPAYFDISVSTEDGSRFPWYVRTGVAVGADVDLGQVLLPLPIVQQGVVDIPNGPTEKATPVPGALIRAYVIRDNLGDYVDKPEGLKSCTSIASNPRAPNTRCIRSVLQVAESRAANDGSFELVLPSSID